MRDNMDIPKHIYAYTCVRTGNKKSDMTKNIKQTKAYQEALKGLKDIPFFYLSEEENYDSLAFQTECTVQIDLVTGAKSNQYFKLNKIIEQSKPNDTYIVITSLNALGDCSNIQKYYKIFRKKKIGVLYIDYTRDSGLSEYSTCGFDFNFLDRPLEDRAYDLVFRLTNDDIKDNRGKSSSEFTLAFRTAYWLYELYRVSEKTAVAMSGFSKNGFHIKANEYEQTFKYKQELEKMDTLYHISQYAKRNRPIPADFDKLIHWYEKKQNLEVACIHCKIPMIFPLDFKRMMLKYEGGKKELARCMKFYDEELITTFDTWVNSGNPPAEFYKETSYYKDFESNNLFSSSIY